MRSLTPWVLDRLPGFLHAWPARIQSSPLGARLARGTFWSITGVAVGRGLALVASVMLARILGEVGFGRLGIVQGTVAMFGAFAGFGMGMTATKYLAEFRVRDTARAGRILGMSGLVAWTTGGLMAVVLYAIAPWLADRTLADPGLASALRISALLLWLSAVGGAQTGALAGFEAFRETVTFNALAGVLSLPLVVGGCLLGRLEGAMWGLVASQAVGVGFNSIAVRRVARRFGVAANFRDCWQERSTLWSFSIPGLLCVSLVAPVQWACSALVVNQPGGYEQMGLFNAANQWFNVLLFLPGVLGQAALPVLAERWGANDQHRFTRVLRFSIQLNAAVVGTLAVIGSLLSPWIMAAYGPGFAPAWPTLVVVLITACLLAIQTPVGQVLVASGKLWTGLWMNLGWGLAFLGFTFLFLHAGAFGFALARAGAYLFHASWTLAFAVHLIRTSARVSASNHVPATP